MTVVKVYGKFNIMSDLLAALLNLSSWCLVMVELLFLAVPRGCLQIVIVVFPDHTHFLFTAYHFRLKSIRLFVT